MIYKNMKVRKHFNEIPPSWAPQRGENEIIGDEVYLLDSWESFPQKGYIELSYVRLEEWNRRKSQRRKMMDL